MHKNSFNLINEQVDTKTDINFKRIEDNDYIEKQRLVKKHLPLIKKFAKESSSGKINPDLMQEMILHTLEKVIPAFNTNKNIKFGTYLYQSLKYYMINRKRDKITQSIGTVVSFDNEDTGLKETIESNINIEEDITQKDLYSYIIDNIEEEYGNRNVEILEEYYVKGKTYRDIAEEMSLTGAGVKHIADKTIKEVRKKLL